MEGKQNLMSTSLGKEQRLKTDEVQVPIENSSFVGCDGVFLGM